MSENKLLEKPSKEKAEEIMREVGFEERLEAVKMTSMTGDKKKSIYSLKNLVNFLEVNKGINPFETNKKGGITYIDLNETVEWIKNTLNDKKLAYGIQSRLKEDESYMNNLNSIKPLLDQRFEQCKEVLNKV
ncbi:MAG: hypothetical protein BTN85_0199 [Candidatus Methanohalarchaeum thermophilum]|uniref:Uncharacterized protein n=1 Tax=Methanohalarchaeum thermophilum TaxID=1903181 RepID=A0A1Q6DTN9_METT1|nr:MAG: hypothetical protein BTN85_0199 [Candidatus Methanohalarchaeum thermophilum]